MPDIEEIGTEGDKKLAESREMHAFYRTLAAVHANMIARVMADDDPDQIVARAVTQTDRMRIFENNSSLEGKGPHKCDKNYVWNETLGRCVPVAE